jgi:Phage-related minor tail protein
MSDTSLLFNIFAVDKASPALGKLGGTWTKLALGVAAAAAGIAVKTTSMAANFQTNMLKVQTGAGELKSNMATVSNGVLDLATKTGDSTSELSSALYTVESGGQHGANGLLVLKAAAQGAKAEGAELNTVADATTSVLQDYHLKASDAALVTSQLVAATGQGKTTFEQLAGSLSAVLPIASQAHISLADIVGAEASMTVHGMSAEQASQNLADTIRHMQSPTLAQVKAMGQLGISSSDVTDKLGSRGITGTLQYLSTTILSKMGPSGKVLLGTFNQSAQAAANVKTMVASMSPSMQALAKQFQAGTISSHDWTLALRGLSPEQANQMQQFATLQKRSTGFSDAIKSGTPAAVSYTAALRGVTGDATGLNTALMLTGENTEYTNNAVAAISKTTTEAGGNVKGWAEIQGTFNTRMSEAKEQVEVLGIKVGTVLLPYMTKLATALGDGVGWLTKHKAVAKDAAIAIGGLAAAVLLYKTYMLAANIATKAAQVAQAAYKAAVLLTRGAIYAFNAVAYISRTIIWDNVTALYASSVAWLKNAASVAWTGVVLVGQKIALVASTVATYAATAAMWLFNAAMLVATSPITLVIVAILALIAIIVLIATKTTWFQTAWHAAWGAVWDFLKMIGAWFAGPFAHFFTSGYDKLKNGISDVHDWIVHKVDAVILYFTGMPKRITKATAGMWDGISDAFKSAINWIIGKWDGLKFSFPSVDTHIPGVGTVGGFTLRPPQIPKLAKGGIVKARRGGTLVLAGEAGQDEMVTPLPNGGRGAAGGKQRIEVVLTGDTPAIRALLAMLGAEIRGSFDGNVDLALGGAR